MTNFISKKRLGRAAIILVSGALSFFISNSVVNRDGKHNYLPPLLALYTCYATNKQINEFEQRQQLLNKQQAAEGALSSLRSSQQAPAQEKTAGARALQQMPLPKSATIQYFFERVDAKTLTVRVRTTDFEPFGAWRKALKQTAGVNWAKKVRNQVIDGRTVCFAKGYVDDSDELTEDEQVVLDKGLMDAQVQPIFKLRPTLAFLELCRHSASHNPPETSFEESIFLSPEFIQK